MKKYADSSYFIKPFQETSRMPYKNCGCCLLQEIKKNAENAAFLWFFHRQDTRHCFLCALHFQQQINMPLSLADPTLKHTDLFILPVGLRQGNPWLLEFLTLSCTSHCLVVCLGRNHTVGDRNWRLFSFGKLSGDFSKRIFPSCN